MYFLWVQLITVLTHYIADSRCNYVVRQGVQLETEICLHKFHSHDITNIDKKKIHHYRRKAMYISKHNNDKPLLIILCAWMNNIIPHYIFR